LACFHAVLLLSALAIFICSFSWPYLYLFESLFDSLNHEWKDDAHKDCKNANCAAYSKPHDTLVQYGARGQLRGWPLLRDGDLETQKEIFYANRRRFNYF
jgi:hypothetical protein